MTEQQMPAIRAAILSGLTHTPVTAVGLLLLAPGMIITDAFFQLPPELPTAERLTVACTGWLAMSATLAVCWRAIRRLLPSREAAVAALAAFMVAGLARELTVLALAQAQEPGVASALWLAARGASTAMWLTVVAIIVDWQRRSSTELARLNGELVRLSQTHDQAELELDRTRAQLAAVRSRVLEAIAGIRRDLVTNPTPSRLQDVADRLAVAVDELVRPSSHSLARGVQPLPRPGQAHAIRQPVRDQAAGIARAWPTALPFQPLAVAGLSVPITVMALLVHPLGPATVVSIAALGGQLVMLVAAARLLPGRLANWGPAAGLAAVIGVYSALLALGLLTLQATSALGAPRLPQAALLPFVTAVTVAGASAVNAERGRAESQTEAVISEIEWSFSRIQEQLWAERRRLAITLHGQVQASLTACEVLIRNWLRTQGPVSVGELVERIDRALADLSGLAPSAGQSQADLASAAIADVWAGILDVQWQASDEARAALAADSDCRDATLEVVRELLLNAVRHSRATRAEVRLGLLDHRTVRVTVVESGLAPERRARPRTPAAREPGIGLALLDAIALDWVARQSPGTRTTDVLLATAGIPAR